MVSETRRTEIRPADALRKCIATVALSGTLPEKLDAAAAVGFDGVEIMEADLLAFDGSPSDVRRICEGLGLSIELYQPFRDFEAMPEPPRPQPRPGRAQVRRHASAGHRPRAGVQQRAVRHDRR